MHIPDGYLGPYTYIFFWIVMIPLWIYAGYNLKKNLKKRFVPLLAMGAAFTFVIMMFNVPIMGGSTGHAVGGTLVAIIVGPWAALISVSVSLLIQALFFADGGITAFGANCFNMAFVLPFVGYILYKLIAGKSDIKSWRHWLGAGIGSYLALVIAGGLTGFEFGFQTILHPAVNGQFPYFMYPVSVAVPAMLFEHIALFGFIEALVTVAVIKYLQGADPGLFFSEHSKKEAHASYRGDQ
jgi:cobalt/nickel transport system permease protein